MLLAVANRLRRWQGSPVNTWRPRAKGKHPGEQGRDCFITYAGKGVVFYSKSMMMKKGGAKSIAIKVKTTGSGAASIKLRNTFFSVYLLFAVLWAPGCDHTPEQQASTRKAIDYIKRIPGTNDSIPADVAQKGEVLIGYSDCYTCHKEDQRSVGPAFKDIAKRYPVRKDYIALLAQKVISGGRGSWGYPVMDPHPKLSLQDAKTMVSYILSLKE
jgi:cytochrome c